MRLFGVDSLNAEGHGGSCRGELEGWVCDGFAWVVGQSSRLSITVPRGECVWRDQVRGGRMYCPFEDSISVTVWQLDSHERVSIGHVPLVRKIADEKPSGCEESFLPLPSVVRHRVWLTRNSRGRAEGQTPSHMLAQQRLTAPKCYPFCTLPAGSLYPTINTAVTKTT